MLTTCHKKVLAWIIGITFPVWIFPLICILPIIFLGGIIILIKDTFFQILDAGWGVDYYDED